MVQFSIMFSNMWKYKTVGQIHGECYEKSLFCSLSFIWCPREGMEGKLYSEMKNLIKNVLHLVEKLCINLCSFILELHLHHANSLNLLTIFVMFIFVQLFYLFIKCSQRGWSWLLCLFQNINGHCPSIYYFFDKFYPKKSLKDAVRSYNKDFE